MSAMGNAYLAVAEAVEAEGGVSVAQIVLGLLEELPAEMTGPDGVSAAFLVDALELYLEFEDGPR